MIVFLIGMPGSGKTHYGKQWAKQANAKFIDLDKTITTAEGISINQIVEQFGWAYFRTAEQFWLNQLINNNSNQLSFIAVGGGTPIFYNNMAVMNQAGVVIYLQQPVSYLVTTILANPNSRPMFAGLNQNEVKEKIEQLLKEREPFYNQAKHILKPNAQTSWEQVAALIKYEKRN
jgi:shikimate kinase